MKVSAQQETLVRVDFTRNEALGLANILGGMTPKECEDQNLPGLYETLADVLEQSHPDYKKDSPWGVVSIMTQIAEAGLPQVDRVVLKRYAGYELVEVDGA